MYTEFEKINEQAKLILHPKNIFAKSNTLLKYTFEHRSVNLRDADFIKVYMHFALNNFLSPVFRGIKMYIKIPLYVTCTCSSKAGFVTDYLPVTNYRLNSSTIVFRDF